MTAPDPRRAIEAVWRIESARLVAGLTRVVRDLGLAEELAQDALVAALEVWPVSGVPEKPGAWLMTTAKRRALDQLRRRERLEVKQAELARTLEERRADERAALEEALDAELEDELGDDLLRLVFMTCHPLLAPEGRVALTLRLLCGLSTEEIARAFLVPEATVAQRILRAKRALAESRVPFELPRASQLAARLADVLEVVYLVFNEGYSATSGADWTRPALCEEALRLGRILAARIAAEPEVHGLVALMELSASRLPARVGPAGEPVLLLDQDRTRWDRLLVRRGLEALERAQALAFARDGLHGRYALQAAIAACHACATTAGETDWTRITELYAALARVAPSPVVELNRAVAVGMAAGAEAGLALVDALRDEPALQGYHLLPSVRADLLAKLGRRAEARVELEHAVSLTRNERERALLIERIARIARGDPVQPSPESRGEASPA